MFQKPVFELIKERYSCRSFDGKAIDGDTLLALRVFVESQGAGPFGTRPKFGLIAALADDASMLKGLGTYGFIKNASAFLVGAANRSAEALIDFGYMAELAVLKATELGLGSCWLGGTFNRSRFATAVGLDGRADDTPTGQTVVCVIALGNFPVDIDPRIGFIRERVGGAHRKPAAALWFGGSLGSPLAGSPFIFDEQLLEAVRLAPSASNKQPWRLVITPESRIDLPRAHLYLQRTPGYGTGLISKFVKLPDIQMVDMGIALSHLALVARAKGMPAALTRRNPGVILADSRTEYAASLNC